MSISVDLVTGVASGGDAEGDQLVSIENVSGSLGSDTIFGDDANSYRQRQLPYRDETLGTWTGGNVVGLAGDDTLDGRGGNDTLYGGSGADALAGGTGEDTAADNSPAAVQVSLLTGVGRGGDADGDTYGSIEKISGSSFGDVIAGDDNANRLYGGGGNDTISAKGGNDFLGGGAGADIVSGGSGSDTVSYFAKSATGGVTVDLSAGTGSGGAAEGDVYGSIENVVGTFRSDRIFGDGGSNDLDGMGGGDVLVGGGGNDVLTSSAGWVDTLQGGDGDDTLILSPSTPDGDVLDGGDGEDTIVLGGPTILLNSGTGQQP